MRVFGEPGDARLSQARPVATPLLQTPEASRALRMSAHGKIYFRTVRRARVEQGFKFKNIKEGPVIDI